jgi:CysZ protein
MQAPAPTYSSTVIPRLSARTSWRDFFDGLFLPFRALRVIARSPRLLALSFLASVVTLASLIGLVFGLWHWTGDLVNLLVTQPAQWWGRALWYLLLAFTFAVLLVAGANTVPLLLLTPLQEPLSEATEVVCGEFRPRPFSLSGSARAAGVALGHTLARVSLLLAGHALLLLLNLIPGAGHPLWVASSMLWTMWWLAVEYLDSPMTRHRYGFADVRRVVLKRFALSLGFGAALYVLLWIPVLNFFLIPLAIVSGTLLYRGLDAAGALPAPRNA